MPRITRPLSPTEIKAAKPKEKEYTLCDGAGLELVIKPNGSKLWRLRYYRPLTKQRNMISFGSYPTMSLADAREKRSEAKTLLQQNIDPQHHRDEQVSAALSLSEHTFEAVAKRWFDVKCPSVTPAYAEDLWRSLEMYLFPEIGTVPVMDIKAQRAIKIIEPIAAAGKLETVRRLTQRVNEIMTFAVNSGLIDANPCSGISKVFQRPAKQHMPSINPNQLPELMNRLSKASINLQTRCLIEWSLHTLARPSEAAGARWAEIDMEKKLWRIPPERMKKRRGHDVPLTPQTLAYLELMRPISGHREFIFPGIRNPKTHTNEQTANAALKRMGYEGTLVAHGLRALGSTTLNERGFDRDVIESALSHSDKDEVRSAYNRTDYLERRREMMVWWSEHIDAASKIGSALTWIPPTMAG
ncbi:MULTISPECIES: integrase domain-containing protein [Aeromonas]|uniref:integrase domain-containing protein n=1 Tax=Aeromonas sp. Prich7-2 TaxID=2823361 RepID=UPI001B320C68|nr:integrase domain-containing protein [Aeromonas sp. Prich7-2]MBP4059550.1 tyrosine-type recombinase/integrase [Aeromonas sp. Prich7-2]